MSLYDPHSRYRQRNLQRTINFLVVLGFMCVSGVIGFWFGGLSASRDEVALRIENDTMRQAAQVAQEEITQMRAEVQTANARFDQLQATLDETIPAGPMRDIVVLIKTQIDEGMDPEQLKFAVLSARPPRNCTDPETKRFVVSTPAYTGADSEITLAEGAIKITGSGVSARNDKGDPEAWYDPSKAVNLTFIGGGKEEKKSGTLPIQHTVILTDKQYRFTIEDGARSFAKVVFDSCDYP